MTEMWGTCGFSPVNTSVFNLKIENFQRLMKILGETGFYSPSFDVADLDGKLHPSKLRVKHLSMSRYKGYPVSEISESGISRPKGEFVLFQVDVANLPDD